MKKILLLLLLGLFYARYSFAQTKIWAGTTTDWHTASNWNPVGVPTASDDVEINTTTNNPVISSAASARSVKLSIANSGLTINNGVILTLSSDDNIPLLIHGGTLTNNGTINVTNAKATFDGTSGTIRLQSNGTLDNAGTVTVSGGLNFALNIAQGTFNNLTGGAVMTSGREVIHSSNTDARFNNNSGATLTGTGDHTGAIFNPGKLTNTGTVNITGTIETYTANSTITNNACGIIKITGDYYNNASVTTTNAGQLQISGDLYNDGTFTNNGVLVANSYPTFTNRRVRINNNATNTTIFTISSSAGSSTINGIFLDIAATNSAGTYTQNNNTFVPGNFAAGTYILYAKVSFGSCTFVVPFTYVKPPTRRYVKTSATGTGDGTSWANATNDIQAMINASASGDSVWIATGVYIPLYDGTGNANPANVRHKIFYMKSGVKLFGGFAGTETSIDQRDFKTNRTIFSGDADNNDTNTDGNFIAESYTDIQGNNSYHVLGVIGCDKTTRIDGITFTAGKSGVSGDPQQTVGSSSLSTVFGPAINITASFPTVTNCVFIGNNGMYGATYHNNVNGTDTVKINNSFYLNNRAQFGGGMFIHRGHTLVDNVVMFNNSSDYGGAVNISSNMQAGKTIRFTNTTIVNNYSTSYKSFRTEAGDVSFINTIIWNETPYNGGNISKSGGTLTSSYSILQNSGAGGIWNDNYGTDGGNNYDGNPFFTDISDIDGADNKFFSTDDGLSLTGCSPGINTGTNSNVFESDITNSPRPYSNGIADIGAYERQSAPTITNAPTNVSVNKTVICPGNTVTLSAQCSTGTITWYNQATGGTAIGTGNNLNQSPAANIIYYSACEAGNCKSERVATAEITISTVSSNISLSASISGTAIYASSNTIMATNKVLSTANVQYLANNSISLDAGFEANTGAVFVAKATPIAACN
ncbi:S-layer family protein [Emticicia sp. BO119]|uniref:beta strand repeat-containing protein n=1 Tax=Emticicia sp. BO119 TaxID=2757768 RepID=UPI0015F10EE6|nr:3-coathanger stack domain-containing protein [Emticicia sp. BO119]MBA4853887.1 hypothetical protein [Emticicia sp. BO119]